MKTNIGKIKDSAQVYPAQKKDYDAMVAREKEQAEFRQCGIELEGLMTSLNTLFNDAVGRFENEIASEAAKLSELDPLSTDEPREPKVRYSVSRKYQTHFTTIGENTRYDVSFTMQKGLIGANNKAFISGCRIAGLPAVRTLEKFAAENDVKLGIVFKCDEPHDTYPNEVKESQFDLKTVVKGSMPSDCLNLRTIEVQLDVSKPYDGIVAPKP